MHLVVTSLVFLYCNILMRAKNVRSCFKILSWKKLTLRLLADHRCLKNKKSAHICFRVCRLCSFSIVYTFAVSSEQRESYSVEKQNNSIRNASKY